MSKTYWAEGWDNGKVELHAPHVVYVMLADKAIELAESLFAAAKWALRPEIHTMVACAKCGNGVRNQYAVLGMCVMCAEGEIERLRGIEKATMHGFENYEDSHNAAAAWWRAMAEIAGDSWEIDICDAIADALEKKAK